MGEPYDPDSPIHDPDEEEDEREEQDNDEEPEPAEVSDEEGKPIPLEAETASTAPPLPQMAFNLHYAAYDSPPTYLCLICSTRDTRRLNVENHIREAHQTEPVPSPVVAHLEAQKAAEVLAPAPEPEPVPTPEEQPA